MRDILFLLCVMLTVCAGVFFLLKLIAADIRTARNIPEIPGMETTDHCNFAKSEGAAT